MTNWHKRIDDLIYPERDGEALMREMAGEIERLEADNDAQLERSYKYMMEIKRLRAAIQEALDSDFPNAPSRRVATQHRLTILRKALESRTVTDKG